MANNYNDKMICRACLCDKQELLTSLLSSLNLMELYTTCTYLQVNNNDNLPKNLCSECINKCFLWHSFKEMCELNESLLLSQLKHGNSMETVEMSLVEDQVKMYLNNSSTNIDETDEKNPMPLNVEFEEVTIKTEFLSDELTVLSDIPNVKQNNLVDLEISSDAWEEELPNDISNKDIDNTINIINDESVFECNQCDAKFPSKDLLKIHKAKRKHSKVYCSHCGGSFSFKSDLTRHVKRKVCQLICFVCNETFESAKEKKCHMITHPEFRPDIYRLTNPIIKKDKLNPINQETIVDCDECGEQFSSKDLMKIHMRKHEKIECFHCGRVFLSKSVLSRHINRKTCQLICHVCNEMFKSLQELKNHKLTHPELRAHKCKKCDKSFEHNGNLIAHLETHMETSNLCPLCGKTFRHKRKFESHLDAHNDKRPFKCNICEKDFKVGKYLKFHIKTHADERPFPCTLCDKSFKTQQYLNRHIKWHNIGKPFKCNECEKCYKTKPDLKSHMRLHTGEKPYKCPICYKSFAMRGVYAQHKQTHLDNFPFKCDFCDKPFHRRSHLVIHTRTHTGERPYKCSVCGKDFIHNYELRLHSEKHADDKPFNCTVCSKSFNLEQNLNLHVKNEHEPSVCSICNELFENKHSMIQHKTKIHEFVSKSAYHKEYVKQMIECKVCKKIVSKGSIFAHSKTHSTDTPFKCTLCPQAFNFKSILKQHIQTHSTERPFNCDQCGKTFKRKSYLNTHIKLHTGDAPTCTLCNKSYTSRADLIIHMRSHTGEKPYQCIICLETFDSPAKLKKHSQKHHV